MAKAVHRDVEGNALGRIAVQPVEQGEGGGGLARIAQPLIGEQIGIGQHEQVAIIHLHQHHAAFPVRNQWTHEMLRAILALFQRGDDLHLLGR